MAANSLGEVFSVTTFGESHGPLIGAVIDGVPARLELDLAAIQAALDRRRPGTTRFVSPRQERDQLEVLSGVFQGRTTGAPLTLVVRNQDARSKDYEQLRNVFRPGHADYTWFKKHGVRDWRGGGRSSGRETVARVAAGAVALQVLRRACDVSIVGAVTAIGDVVAEGWDTEAIGSSPLRCADSAAAPQMEQLICTAQEEGDSWGGVVEVRVTGVPAGWGEPVFDKLDACLAHALMSIGGVKGVEIGDGFALSRLTGSQANDALSPDGFQSNRAGGILGGISSGASLTMRLAIKPTSSIRRPQQTVDVDGNPTEITVPGRHDPCLCPRIVPVAEAMVAIVLCDAMLRQRARAPKASADFSA